MADSETVPLPPVVELAIVDGPGKGGSIRVPVGSRRVLGRDASADERLGGDQALSRRHAMLEHVGPGVVRVVDLNSTNGVYVGGRRIFEPAELNPGDRVQLGQTVLMLEPVTGATPSGGEHSRPGEQPVASYLDGGEEWHVSAPERASGAEAPVEPLRPSATERVSPAPQAQPERSASSTDDAVPAPGRRGGAHVRGVARNVQIREAGETNSGSGSVLSFRVDQYDTAGNRVQPVGVEMPMYRSGQLSDGEEVDVTGRWKSGTLRADRIINLTTGATVNAVSRLGAGVMKAVIAIFACGVIGFIVYGFVTAFFS